ncbi:hypothetical protein QBC37DRAFT_353539 [Rhypophila decipiens]|uniref:Uncharacterized protein n=1 Tax=Rhypophila decipiens TaxID=261697 RepID=A0AAN7B3D4_9PEZI|nr:hypothetical protein QBC37DRAFT_353539 [Rhypophila decipiens]
MAASPPSTLAVAATSTSPPAPIGTVPLLAPRAASTAPPVTATPIYIDLIDGYKALPPCAVVPLSTIVRDMEDGCGDGGKLTSYSCFCTNSYSRFSWQISTAVLRNCPDVDSREEMATSAVGVFRGYCTSGREQLTATKAVSSSSEGADGAGSGTTSTGTSFVSVIGANETQSSNNTSRSKSVSVVTAAVMMLVVLAAGSSCVL